MPAPIVIPMAENMSTFTNFAEKANVVSENKCKLQVELLESKTSEKLAKMTKEMNDLKYELSQIKPVRRGKRDSVKEPGRNSPLAKLSKSAHCDTRRDNEENVEPKRKTKSGDTMAERAANERITNLERRYKNQLGNDVKLSMSRTSTNIKGQKL
ncbi:hypothetical protein ACF0H5_008045 [Mactra antiquata]